MKFFPRCQDTASQMEMSFLAARTLAFFMKECLEPYQSGQGFRENSMASSMKAFRARERYLSLWWIR